MGNNDRYTFFEHTVITLYDSEKLDAQLLDALAEQHRGTDIDAGGSRDLKTLDGLELPDVILFFKVPNTFRELREVLQRLQRAPSGAGSDNLLDKLYYEPRFDAVHAITSGEWGWL